MWDKSIAFVKYRNRSNAEFAKEAMTDQSLDGDELLTIRWSNEDPNPSSKEEDEQKALMRLAQAVAKKQKQEEPQYAYGEEPQDGETPTHDHFPSQYYPEQYPSTDNQYSETQYDYSQVIKMWLQSVGLEKYTDSFLSAGYFDLQTLGQLDDIGLDLVGVANLEERTQLLALAKQAVLYSQTQDNYAYTNQEYHGLDPNVETQTETSEGAPLVSYGSDDE